MLIFPDFYNFAKFARVLLSFCWILNNQFLLNFAKVWPHFSGFCWKNAALLWSQKRYGASCRICPYLKKERSLRRFPSTAKHATVHLMLSQARCNVLSSFPSNIILRTRMQNIKKYCKLLHIFLHIFCIYFCMYCIFWRYFAIICNIFSNILQLL